MLASVVGEDGGDERTVCPFFSEEWEDRDSRLPVGVVSGLLLYVSPAGRHGRSGYLKDHRKICQLDRSMARTSMIILKKTI